MAGDFTPHGRAVATREHVGSGDAHEKHGRLEVLDEVRQEIERVLVGVLEIVEDEDERHRLE